MKEYIVEGSFSFKRKAKSSNNIRNALIKAIKQEGLSEVGFEITIALSKSPVIEKVEIINDKKNQREKKRSQQVRKGDHHKLQ